jgi:hypothetical protein
MKFFFEHNKTYTSHKKLFGIVIKPDLTGKPCVKIKTF